MGKDGIPKVGKEYRIISRLTDKVVDGKDCNQGTSIILYNYHGGENQRWRFEKAHHHNSFHIISCKTGKALDIRGSSKDNGAEVLQYGLHSGPNQTFHIEPVGDKYVRIRAAHSGKVLDLKGSSTENSTPILQWDCHDGHNQHWRIAKV